MKPKLRIRRQKKVAWSWRAKPKFDPDLPADIEGIRKAQEALILKMSQSPTMPMREQMPDGSVKIHMDENLKLMIRLQLQLFRATFHREPSPHDPVFWDPDRVSEGPKEIDPEKAMREMRKAALSVGIRPELAYAMGKTGFVVTERNKHLFSEDDLDEWQNAVEEYKSTH